MKSELKHIVDWLPTKGGHALDFIAASIILSPITHFINRYIFDDPQFIVSLTILIAIDTCLSVAYNWKNKSISSAGFGKILIKVIIYGVFLIVIHTGTHLNIKGEAITLLQWLDSFGYTAIYVREALSIIEKAEMLRPGTIPVWITRRLRHFDDTGKLTNESNTP